MQKLLLAAVLAVATMPLQAARYIEFTWMGPSRVGYAPFEPTAGLAPGTIIDVEAHIRFELGDNDAILDGGEWMIAGATHFWGLRTSTDTAYGPYLVEIFHFPFQSSLSPLDMHGAGFAFGIGPTGNYEAVSDGQTGTLALALVDTDDVLDTGLVDITVTPASIPPAIPEPSTWAMLVLGFGVLGGAIRRRPLTLQLAQ